MKRLFFIFSLLFSITGMTQVNHVVISQVYGGGGNSGATYTHDFIELFNPTSNPVSLDGWSVQYASAAGTTWAKTNLSGTIPAYGYYLVQQAQGSGGTQSLPTPDATGTIAMSATAGKVALVSNNTTLSGSCPTQGVVDYVGFGSTANCFEGSGPTATIANTTAAIRKDGGCIDTDNNSADFATGAPTPRNTASPVNTLCGGSPSLPSLSINDLSMAEGNSGTTTFTFTVSLSSPAPAGGVNFDIATTNGTALAGIDYVARSLTGQTIAEGLDAYSFSVTVNGDTEVEADETFYVNVTNVTGATVTKAEGSATIVNDDVEAGPLPRIVINQLYGGGGNSGAEYKNDFIELYNNEAYPVSLSGWSVQYASAAGSSWTAAPLTGSIPAKGFYLVQGSAGSGGTMNLPTPDAISSLSMSATTGKLVLSNSTAALSGTNPSGDNVIDKLGFGTANGFETAPAPAPSNTTSIKRLPDGTDTDNNAVDFTTSNPEPRNSSYTITPPVIVSTTPPDNSTQLPVNTRLSILFNKPIQKGNGNISIFEDGNLAATIDINSGNTTVSGKTLAIDYSLSSGKNYYILVDAGTVKDSYNNAFAGIADPATWNFSTWDNGYTYALPAGFDFNACTGTGLLPGGFSQFSETGTIVWDCTPFGRDASDATGKASSPNGIQMNGFANGTNVHNVDWLISPAFDLTGSTYPLLSFWSRTAFNGPPLQLKVSTDYPGTGDPRNYSWEDLNGKFPSQASDTWTISDNINLSAFKQPRVFLAFIYTSSGDEGARWTIDDLSIINSSTPPPPSLTVATADINFNYVAAGNTADRTFTFIANDMMEDLGLSATGDFILSKDGSSFSSSLTYTEEEANNLPQTVYVRFAPSAVGQNFTGAVNISMGNLSHDITLKGTSIDPVTTLEVVNWNVEWFGSPTLGPTNDDLQEQNILAVMQQSNADIYGLVEVVDESRLANVVNQMPGYAYVISNYGSHTNPYSATAGPLSEAQKMAFVYRTSVFSNVSTEALLSAGIHTAADLSNPAYNYWASGRFPYMMSADVTLNGLTKHMRFVLVHAKANTSPTATSYERRKKGADTLQYTLNNLYPDDLIVMLGDFNDDLDQSITAGFTTTSYSAFTSDTEHFYSPTLALSEAGKKSTVSYNDIIDHVMLSNEMATWYMPGTASILTDVASTISRYGSTTSDHYPVFTRYMFCQLNAPAGISVSNDAGECGATVTYSIPASFTCGTVTATTPSGSFFPVGSTTVTVTASTGEMANFEVVVSDDEKPVIIAPVVPVLCFNSNGMYALQAMSATDNCGVASYSYDISGATNRSGTGTNASGTFNTGISVITWTVTDIHGNTATATTTVQVNTPVTASIADAYAFSGAAANTLYTGYGPFSLTLQGSAGGGSGAYNYKWTTGSSAGQGLSTSSSFTVSPASTTTYVLNVKDDYGCAASLTTTTITVMDVRCGPKMDKVTVCTQNNKGIWTTSCVLQKDVPAILANGGYLGACGNAATTRMNSSSATTGKPGIQLSAMPNPSTAYFNLLVSSENSAPIQLRVIDLLGRTVELRSELQPNSQLKIGSQYQPGVYLVEVVQGEQRRQLKLVKQ